MIRSFVARVAGLSVAAKLWLSFVVIVLAQISVIASVAGRSGELATRSHQSFSKYFALSDVSAEMASLGAAKISALETLARSQGQSLDVVGPQHAAAKKRIAELKDVVSASGDSKASALTAEALSHASALDRIWELIAAGGAVEQARIDEASKAYMESLAALRTHVSVSFNLAKEAAEEGRAENIVKGAIQNVVVMSLLGFGAILLINSIRRPLNQAISFAQRIAGGDLTVSLDSGRKDEFGRMSDALEEMRKNLSSLVGDVRRGTESINVASREIAVGNNDLSSRTEQTAANLQRAASSMSDLSTGISQTADSARTANQLAVVAGESAQEGGEVVKDVIETMGRITAASHKIVDIISSIDAIAFQTNILALNAAVEAARAGDQGRGFAVVASEVRQLAQRSAEAAKEIKQLINNSVTSVNEGSAQVELAGRTMEKIVTNVTRVSDIIGEIATTAVEQAGGLRQINGALNDLDQMTQQNAALVEESAAAATSMQEQSNQLSAIVQMFRTDCFAAAPAPAAAPVDASVRLAARVQSKPVAPRTLAQSKPLAAAPATAPTASPAPSDSEWETF